MKALTSPESPGHKARRKVSKPMMEKRRRERINSSLETLRLLMLENTQNEKLKNPKVEKAEILESVVEFLKKEKKDTEEDHQAARKTFPEEQRPTFSTHHSYQDGMRSCLLRVSQFIASKNRELEGSHALQASLELSECETVVSSAVPLHVSPLVVPANVPAVLSPQHLLFQQSETRQMLSSSSSSTVPAHFTDPVWRPWPK